MSIATIREGGREGGRKQLGLDLVEDHNFSFVDHMRDLAIAISNRDGQVTSDDLRRAATRLGIEPDHQNAWGAIFRGKRWKPMGYVNSTLPSNHARVIRVWRWV